MTLTTKEFRDDPERVAALRVALEQPIIVEAMAILNARGPIPSAVAPDISPTYAAVRLGAVEGFAEYATSLAQLATHPPDNEPLTSEYKREEEE